MNDQKENIAEDATQIMQNMAVPKSRLAYILLAIFLGSLGVHNFYAGYTKKAVIQLILGLLSFLVIPGIILLIWIIIDIVKVTEDSEGTPFH